MVYSEASWRIPPNPLNKQTTSTPPTRPEPSATTNHHHIMSGNKRAADGDDSPPKKMKQATLFGSGPSIETIDNIKRSRVASASLRKVDGLVVKLGLTIKFGLRSAHKTARENV